MVTDWGRNSAGRPADKGADAGSPSHQRRRSGPDRSGAPRFGWSDVSVQGGLSLPELKAPVNFLLACRGLAILPYLSNAILCCLAVIVLWFLHIL